MEPVGNSREIGEFGLLDYVRMVWRWRWLVLAGTLAGVVVALLLTMLAGASYRVVAAVDAGDLKEGRDRDLDRLAARLTAGLIDPPERSAGEPPPRVAAQYKRPYTIELSAESRHPSDGMAAVERATAAALREVTRLYELQRTEDQVREEVFQARLDRLRREVSFREERLRVLRGGLEQLERARAAWARPSSDPIAALIFAQLSEQIAARELSVTQLEEQIKAFPSDAEEVDRQLRVAQLAARGRAPRLAVQPQPVPTARRLTLPLALGLVVGLMGSVVVAVSYEYARAAWRRAAPASDSATEPEVRSIPAEPGR